MSIDPDLITPNNIRAYAIRLQKHLAKLEIRFGCKPEFAKDDFEKIPMVEVVDLVEQMADRARYLTDALGDNRPLFDHDKETIRNCFTYVLPEVPFIEPNGTTD